MCKHTGREIKELAFILPRPFEVQNKRLNVRWTLLEACDYQSKIVLDPSPLFEGTNQSLWLKIQNAKTLLFERIEPPPEECKNVAFEFAGSRKSFGLFRMWKHQYARQLTYFKQKIYVTHQRLCRFYVVNQSGERHFLTPKNKKLDANNWKHIVLCGKIIVALK